MHHDDYIIHGRIRVLLLVFLSINSAPLVPVEVSQVSCRSRDLYRQFETSLDFILAGSQEERPLALLLVGLVTLIQILRLMSLLFDLSTAALTLLILSFLQHVQCRA